MTPNNSNVGRDGVFGNAVYGGMEQEQAMKAQELIDYLTYTNYKANRGYTPEVTPEQWEKVYGPSVYAMEEKYKAEKAFARMEESYWDSRANT